MDYNLNSSVLNVDPKSIDIIRKEYNLDGPGRMEEAVNILREWIQQQAHFKKKDYPLHYLESSIIISKGSIERAKKQLDRICTMRTMTPQYFTKCNVKDFEEICNQVSILNMPNATEDFYRINIIKIYKTKATQEEIQNILRYAILLSEYTIIHDYYQRFITILDIRGLNLLELTKSVNPLELKHLFSVLTAGHGVRIKSINIISESKIVDVVVSVLKQVVSKKVGSRIHVLKTHEELHAILPRKILPKEYGGDEKSLKELMNDWVEVLSSKENIAYFEEMSQAGTDETCRLVKSIFNEEYAGMCGTFRTLTVD